jgi:hypothetical protein
LSEQRDQAVGSEPFPCLRLSIGKISSPRQESENSAVEMETRLVQDR